MNADGNARRCDRCGKNAKLQNRSNAATHFRDSRKYSVTPADPTSFLVTSATAETEPVTDSVRDQWTALYDRYNADVWRYVANLIGSDANAVGDAVQETFLAAARGFHQFDPERGTHWAWLTGIAHRQVALHWRRATRNRVDPTAEPAEESSGDGDAVSRLMKLETVETVRQVLAELPAESAALLTAKYCDGLSVAAIVERFGGTTEGVRSKLARSRREFRKRYENREKDD